MCLAAGGGYYLCLLAITALFFGGQYQGVGVTALMVLGYTRAEAQTALKGVDAKLSLEEMITAALRKMALKF